MYNVYLKDEKDITDDLCMIALLDEEDSPSPSRKAVVITLVIVVVVFLVYLAL